MMDLHPILQSIKAFLPEIAAYQLSFFRNPSKLQGYLKGSGELVSEVDIASERMIHAHLASILPEASFYGEETARDIGDDWTWVVDPIDGTVNYVSGLDEWAISIGLLYQRVPVLGTVYKPSTGELFSAIAGHGAWLQERPLPILPFHGTLREAVIATAFPFRSPDIAHGFYRCAERMLPHCREIRRFGSASLDLSYVAAGFLQGYWETDLKLYDVAAALVILQETEVVTSDFFGNGYDPFTTRSLIAAHREIADDLREYISSGYAGYRDILYNSDNNE